MRFRIRVRPKSLPCSKKHKFELPVYKSLVLIDIILPLMLQARETEKSEPKESPSSSPSPEESRTPTPQPEEDNAKETEGKAEAEDSVTVEGTLQESDRLTKDLAGQMNSYLGHPLVSALVAVLIFVALGKIVDWIVTVVFAKLVTRTKSDLDDKILSLLHSPIFLSVLLIGLGLATYTLNLPARVTTVTVHILQSIAVFVWFRFGLNLTRAVVDEVEESKGGSRFVTPTTKPVIVNFVSIILVAFAVYIIFLIWGINITAWIASAGIIGLAVSFAAKDTLANVFGGVAIFADKPFKVGDYVVLADQQRGVITQIGVRSTRILTRDDIEITVPNGILATTTIVNESGGPHEKFRIRAKVGVAYGSDIDQVEAILIKIAKDHKEVCASPAPRVRLRRFGESSLDYELLCWVEKPVLRGRVLHELNREIYHTFAREGVVIPFPQRDVHLKQSEA